LGKKMNKEEVRNKAAEYLYSREEILSAYIFGSFVNREKYHDIDIAVRLKNDFIKNDLKKFPYGYESYLIAEMTQLLRFDVDIIVMNNAEILIQQRIVNKGITIVSKDEAERIRYENFIRKMYIDTEQLRNIKYFYLNKRITGA
jgi:uncharacterized protein